MKPYQGFMIYTVPSLSKEPKETSRYSALGILAILFWSTSVGFGRTLTEQVGPLRAAAWIHLLGGTVSCALIIVRGSAIEVIRHSGPRYLCGCGGLFAAYMICLYLGIGLSADRLEAVQVGLINYLWPALTLVLAVPILKWKAKAVPLSLGIGLALFGMALAAWDPGDSPALFSVLGRRSLFPSLLGLMAAVAWASYSNLSRLWGKSEAGSTVPVFILATGILLLGLATIFPEPGRWTGVALWNLLYLAMVPTFLAYLFWDRAVRRGNFILVASFGYLTPLLSTLVSAAYLGVQPGLRLWIACALVIGGAAFCNRAFEGQKTPQREEGR